MPQPDVCVWIDQTHGGQAQLTEDDYLAGSPELIVEVAASSAAYDLHDKRNAYRRNGVPEYLVLLTYEQRAIWHHWHEGQYAEVLPDEQGIIRSQVFPGLWLEPARFWAGDLAGLLALVQQGVNSPEHADFVQRLADAARPAS
jgi:Uma2 family endonuclease